jgi:RecA-family ATPase
MEAIFEEAKRKANGGDGDLPPLAYVDLARNPIPERKWAVRDRIPAGNVTLLSGEGAIGKSILLMQLAAAHVLERDWIQTLPEPGPALVVNCEEDGDEICRRFEQIAQHYSTSRLDLHNRGLRVISRVGQDAILAFADRNEHVQATPLFHQVKAEIAHLKPVMIIIDNAADVFAGSEISRTQTRQFIALLRGLTLGNDAAVVLSAHPSLTGISSGTGLSGSTAWHNSVRARLYFHPAPGDDPELRVLETMKSNYSAKAENILLRWKNGVYVPEPHSGSLEQLAAEQKVNELFLTLLRRFTDQNRIVSDRSGPNFAPAMFAQELEAKAAKLTSSDLAGAMRRLFASNKIRVISYGRPSRPAFKIIVNEG